jgi:hypothetical protein
MDFVFWEDKMAFPGPTGRVGHPDLTQNIGQTPSIFAADDPSNSQCAAALVWLNTAPSPQASTAAIRRPSGRNTRGCPTAYTPR